MSVSDNWDRSEVFVLDLAVEVVVDINDDINDDFSVSISQMTVARYYTTH
jgi:hypothetical protein